ncbi:MAG TPA: HAMP domain-containing sensor histidine kinase [Ramlibacter sp.]|uniref:sensor histidine kinase n=1 Tax=Ramlibacter sp. TaxID=1917967 RepID=UPI002D80ADD9|nr:HAMP domain-containing sensor histidine kinase [Ramlibacter sp.]HET8747778.1 HAMP domain-containing sensor histidine kinase [Ramlibacter sp.]
MDDAAALPAPPAAGWHRRAHRRLRHSLRARLVLLFLLLALGITAAFVAGMQAALGQGWRGAVRPLLADYVDRLVAEIGSPPSVQRAQAIAARLPVTIAIDGPALHWRSHPEAGTELHSHWADREDSLLTRTTADGHRIAFGLSVRPWQERPRRIGWFTLAAVLLFTAVAYRAVRRLLRPLEDIRAGAQRFGRGTFGEPIPVRRRDELGDLAADVNAMAASIHQMLEAKRALLLAISHELRSPLTRARLHTELLPEAGEGGARRAALLRELQEMADLVTDLLESERLGQGHAALQREPTDIAAFVREVLQDAPVEIEADAALASLQLDRARMRLLLRNLVDNARRHGGAAREPLVRIAAREGEVVLTVRDFGPGVDAGVLPQLAEPFFRPDAARERATGGVGLGLYLCKLVAQAHGGRLVLRNAQPGLAADVLLPIARRTA